MGLSYKAIILCRRVMPCSGGRNRIHRLEYSEYPCYRNTTGMLSRARHGPEVPICGPLGTVPLVHYALQEYRSYNSYLFLKPHTIIIRGFSDPPNFRQLRSTSPTLRSAPPTVLFFEYASCHWGTHVRRETTELVQMLASNLLDGYDEHI